MENLEASRVEVVPSPRGDGENDILAGLLTGYRFSVCDTDEEAAEALEIRRRVYVEGVGYDVPVPDAYDARSWLLLARDESTGKAVGSMRLTPRFAGPFELEEYFTLPKSLRGPKTIEINRFAILPEYRKGKTFLPVVSLGLFKTVMRFAESLGASKLVIASKPERIWTYEWLRFQRTGRTAQYGALDAVEHELLTFDFRKMAANFAGNPCDEFLRKFDDREVVLPRQLPQLGRGVDLAAERFGYRKSA
jgi:N-acyl-L-homoserine lactone synthetase